MCPTLPCRWGWDLLSLLRAPCSAGVTWQDEMSQEPSVTLRRKLIPALPLLLGVTWDECLHLSEPQYAPLESGATALMSQG